MPKHRWIVCASIALLSWAPVVSSAQTQKDRHVVVISLDGFPSYALEDPRCPVPTLRSLMKEGSWARHMQPVNPSVTWPNHTTMVTGLFPRDHGLLYNGTMIHTAGTTEAHIDSTVAKDKMVHVPTLYDKAHEAGLTTAQSDWVAINDASTIDWAFPERAKPSDKLVAEMIANGALQQSDIAEQPKRSVLWLDQIWTNAAIYILKKHQPNLLLMHLLTLDTTSHTYGPKTLGSNDAMAFLDGQVARVLSAIKEAGIADRTTVLVVSDHGFSPVTKHIQLAFLLKQLNLTDKVNPVPEGGSAMFYVAAEGREKTLTQLKEALGKMEGVTQVATEGQFNSLGLPTPDHDVQMADLVAYAQPGYGFARERDVPEGQLTTSNGQQTGAHGYLNTLPEMQALFIAAGPGIRKGAVVDQITNRKVAPTIAQLLGLKLPKTEEGPLTEVLDLP